MSSSTSVQGEIMDLDLDLNQEPDSPPGLITEISPWLTELETAHERIEDRLRQLEAIVSRIRERAATVTTAAATPSPAPALIPPRDSTAGVIHERSRERLVENDDKTYLIAKALNMERTTSVPGGYFDCNICLEKAEDPILTCCGHLFCWGCFYQLPFIYLNIKECPVCDGEVTWATELFNTCLSRSRASSTTSCLPDTGTPELVDTTEEQQTFVPSTRKLRKKARRSSLMTGNDDQGSRTTWEGIDVPRVRKPSKYRKKRERISRNEAEMSQGVKIVADMERIRTKLEEESGKVASMSCWAEAAGMNEKLLMRNLHFGWYCRDELVKCTRSLVLFLARNYRGLGIAHEDLIQAGYVGVLQGAERFDHTRGYKFSTYVQYWIRKSMSMMVSRHARGVHIPASIIRTMSQIQKARKTLKTSQGIKYPADEEISKLTGYSLKKIRAANQCLKVVGSIDKKVGDCFTTKFLEFTPDTTMESPEEAVMRQSARREVHNLIEGLEAREKQVMVLRYGLQDYRPKSLEEIGKLLRVSKEGIRKIERRAMAKLRDQPKADNLRYYLNQ